MRQFVIEDLSSYSPLDLRRSRWDLVVAGFEFRILVDNVFDSVFSSIGYLN